MSQAIIVSEVYRRLGNFSWIYTAHSQKCCGSKLQIQNFTRLLTIRKLSKHGIIIKFLDGHQCKLTIKAANTMQPSGENLSLPGR